MVPNNRQQMFGTIGNGPEESKTNVRDRRQWSRTIDNKCSGPLAMVPNICCKISWTVCYCPYIPWMQIGPFCYQIGYINIKGNLDKKVLNGQPYI